MSGRFNKSEIMKTAWAMLARVKFADHAARMRWFSRKLKQAWFDAKMALHRAQLSAADRIREAIMLIENKSRWNDHDKAQLSKLRTELAQEI